MGTANNGSFMGFKGKVGGLVCYTLKGKTVIRSVGYSSKPPSLKQLAQYQQMRVLNAFLKPMLGFINIGFATTVAGTDRNAYNEAFSVNKRHALQGEYPDVSVDHSKAVVSMGDLPVATDLSVTTAASGERVDFSWSMAADMEWVNRNDRAMLLLYFPSVNGAEENGESLFVLSGARRADCQDYMELPLSYRNRPMVAWLAFIADNRNAVSNSVFSEVT